jgi:hypothetical protein
VRNNIIYQQRALCYNFDTKLWTITTENTSTAEETITPVSLSLAAVITIIPKGIPQFTDQSRFEGKKSILKVA